ncbi:MAG: PQQ-binding-like beta-propeller repeat protein [Acidobacteria bacterium]|nr:PQQ-binding-like beta-propeller repeat protein [Acidobacteriota bacterium]
MRHSIAAAMLLATALLAAPHPAAQDARGGFVPVTDAMLQKPDPADWLMWRRTLDTWGYSPLDQITANNVRTLRLVWTRPLGPGIQEGTPLVYDGVMYFPNPLDHIQAIDARTGDLKWEYRRKLPEDLNKFFPVPAINRNLAIYGSLIIDTSADDYVFGLNAQTGELAWETKILDYQKGAQQTSGPIVANGKIISGRGCEPEGGPEACVITAHDATTGKELWRTRTIPAPGEPGSETWGDVPYEERLHVGTWLVPSYDPALNLIYIGTSVSSPAPKFLLGGNDRKHLYHNSTLALNADTGKIVWYYQHVVDHWDLDHPFERLLVDTAVVPNPSDVRWINPRLRPGERRRVITGVPGKTGLVYTLDRETGEFLWARPTVLQTVISNIDGATGEVTVNPDALFNKTGDQRFICPTTNGGKNWEASAYSPLTNMMYVPLQNTCMETTAVAESRKNTSLYGIANKAMIATGTDNVGTIFAISAETGATAWKFEQRAGTTSLVATGSGLLFGGDANGRFRAFDQRTGEVLWEVNLGSAVTGYPVTFAVDGRQYVAVSTGTSLATGGVGRLTPELRPGTGSNLFVFALPE